MVISSVPLQFLGHYYRWQLERTLSAEAMKSVTAYRVSSPRTVIGIHHLMRSTYDIGSMYMRIWIIMCVPCISEEGGD
jgi:hypothetical protein